MNKTMNKVYLAGPIHECSRTETFTWRMTAEDMLTCPCINPAQERGCFNQTITDPTVQIVEPDKRDILDCSIVLANCWKKTCGTAMEILYAWENGKVVVSVWSSREPCSIWVTAHSHIVVGSVREACEWINDSVV